MIQEIITYIILIYSFGITIYKGIGFFSLFGSKATNPCSSCSGGGCALKPH
ncbi:MAG: hypothetical protein KAH25_12005 [Bacteroidales bacterium]|nr:hypothetical protein [Bacteroidales bacterium]